MSVALITGSCGLVGSESALFFSKKDLKLSALIIIQEIFFGKDGDISWVREKLKKN